jgi:hypothetical protein
LLPVTFKVIERALPELAVTVVKIFRVEDDEFGSMFEEYRQVTVPLRSLQLQLVPVALA